jgi:hypothetical protein
VLGWGGLLALAGIQRQLGRVPSQALKDDGEYLSRKTHVSSLAKGMLATSMLAAS